MSMYEAVFNGGPLNGQRHSVPAVTGGGPPEVVEVPTFPPGQGHIDPSTAAWIAAPGKEKDAPHYEAVRYELVSVCEGGCVYST